MNTFYINQPVAHGKHRIDKIEVLMGFLPTGKENAIKRKDFVDKCVEAGLINPTSSAENKYRAMRKMLERAKVDYKYSITNDGDGKGYYRPTKEEVVRLARNNQREDKKAISTFRSSKVNKALAEDYKHGRIGGDV